MDSKESTERTAGPLNHPAQAEWMAFLYGETPAKTRRELHAHLDACPACTAQVNAWRASMTALDSWTLPRRRATTVVLLPVAKWAAAAAVLILLGFFLGRRGTPSADEIAGLKASVAQLNQLVQSQSASTVSNSVAAAGDRTTQLLAEYSRSQEEQRVADRAALNLAIRGIQARINRLDSDIQTVADNTESGFEQTHENIARVVSLSMSKPNASTPQ
jgi:anti-sigma factor RsiW